MRILTTIAVIVLLVGCQNSEGKKDVYLKCEGIIQNVDKGSDYAVKHVDNSSFYIGKDFVEQDGKRYSICEEMKTNITFAQDCTKRELTEGTVDLVSNEVHVNKMHAQVMPNIQTYDCKVAKNPRY